MRRFLDHIIGRKSPTAAGCKGGRSNSFWLPWEVRRKASRFSWRRKALALALMPALALPFAGVVAGSQGGQVTPAVSAMAIKALSVMALLDLRSPGTRTAGQLTSSKPVQARALPRMRSVAPPAQGPQQRALGKIFPPLTAAIPGSDLVVPFPSPVAFNFDDLPSAALGTAIPSALSSAAGPFGVTPGGGGGGGGGGASPEQPGAVIVDLPVTAVPEPSTWFMMIVGFGLCGLLLRRSRSPASSSSCSAQL